MLFHLKIKGWGVGVLAALVPLMLPLPASASNWVQADRFDWIDMDSIVRSGNVTAYTSVHAIASPVATGASGSRHGVDCTTRREYWQVQGQLVAVPNDNPAFDGYMSASDPRFRLLCPNAPSSASRSPAAVAPKPTQPVSVKRAAVSDLAVCKTYSPDHKSRIAACTRIIESPNPRIADLVVAHYSRCAARFLANEKVDDALADCTRAVTLDPKSFDAIETRGNVNSLAGRLDAGIADLTQAIALNPKYIIPYGNRAELYVRKKDLQKAIADYAAARDLTEDPKAGEATFRDSMCWARFELNVELNTALVDCDSAVRLEPSAYTYKTRALVRLRMGNLKEARADVESALSLDRKSAYPSAYPLYTRAILNAREGKTMASYDDMAAAQKIDSFVASDFDNIGLKLTVQPDTAPFCPAMTAFIKAAGERASSKAKADVAMPGATYCTAIDRGYWCAWETGTAQAVAKQKALATAAGACLSGYTRKDNANTGGTGPASEFSLGKTSITIGTMLDPKTSSIHAAGVAVTIAK